MTTSSITAIDALSNLISACTDIDGTPISPTEHEVATAEQALLRAERISHREQASLLGSDPALPAGPWRAGPTYRDSNSALFDWRTSIAGTSTNVALVIQGGARPHHEAEAIARLFTAAPKLLEGTRAALEWVEHALKVGTYPDPEDAIHRQRAALQAVLAFVDGEPAPTEAGTQAA